MDKKRLLPSLLVELYQAEHSACRHALREATRLGQIPPAVALRVISSHASSALDDLPGLAHERGLVITTISTVVGDAYSYLREVVLDRVVDVERAYRETILDVRRGVDLVRLLRSSADDEGDHELVAWCDKWLPIRTRLVREAADELEWFARHPVFARRISIPFLSAKPTPA